MNWSPSEWELCAIILGIFTGLLGMGFGIYTIHHQQFLTIHQYMAALEDPEFIKAREHLYNIQGTIPLEDEKVSLVVNFYHHWGFMARRGYLPLWVFDYGFGPGTLRMCEMTAEYINACREKHGDLTYAENVTWLHHKLKKRQKRKGWGTSRKKKLSAQSV